MIAKSKCTIVFGGARTWKDRSLARQARSCEFESYAMVYVSQKYLEADGQTFDYPIQ